MKRLSPPWLPCWIMDACLVIIFQYHSLVFVFNVAISFSFFYYPSSFRWGRSLPFWPKESGDVPDSQWWHYSDSIITEEAGVVITETSPFLIHASIVQRNKRSESADVTSESIAEVLQTSWTNGKNYFWKKKLAKAEVKQVGDEYLAGTIWIQKM